LKSAVTPPKKKKKKILIAEHSGFCYGVKMAVDKAFELADKSDRPVYVLGELIHNPQVIEKLKNKNVKTVRSVDEIPTGSSCIIRTHGETPGNIDSVKIKDVQINDATCPDVSRVQQRAIQLVKEGYTLIVVGRDQHPEVIGIMAHSEQIPDAKIVAINSTQELHEKLKSFPKTKIGIVSQTTQLEETFFSIVKEVSKIAREMKVFNTICPATFKRQTAAEKLAKDVDLMVVIGGKNSSNTTHLKELCVDAGTQAIHIETLKELIESPLLDDASIIGVTAGASTPNWIVDEVIQFLESLNNVET